jgi:predicted aconitase with swiveling domain
MSKTSWQATCLVNGSGSGRSLILDEPLSLWGGLNPQTGEIIDRRHPQSGEIVSGRVLILPAGRGSSSASSVLLEAVRAETAPAAIITAEADGILALGAVVAQEIYGQSLPVVVLVGGDFTAVCTHLSTMPQAIVHVQNELVFLGNQEIGQD